MRLLNISKGRAATITWRPHTLHTSPQPQFLSSVHVAWWLFDFVLFGSLWHGGISRVLQIHCQALRSQSNASYITISDHLEGSRPRRTSTPKPKLFFELSAILTEVSPGQSSPKPLETSPILAADTSLKVLVHRLLTHKPWCFPPHCGAQAAVWSSPCRPQTWAPLSSALLMPGATFASACPSFPGQGPWLRPAKMRPDHS